MLNLRAAFLPFVPQDGGLEDERAVQSITSRPGETISDLVEAFAVHQMRNNSFLK